MRQDREEAAYRTRMIAALGPDPAKMYEAGKLRPEFTAHVDQLRDLLTMNANLTGQATELRGKLSAFLKR